MVTAARDGIEGLYQLTDSKTDGIPLVASDLGGDVGRVIHFFSDGFTAYSKKMGKIRQEKIVQKEKGFWKRSIEEEEAVPERKYGCRLTQGRG